MILIDGSAGARELVSQTLVTSSWVQVDQRLIDLFARMTCDLQWIHVDSERAQASASGTTIAHGLLTLSLGPRFSYGFTGVSYGVDYGYGRVASPRQCRPARACACGPTSRVRRTPRAECN
ncbi:hypothetical protein DSM104329_02364 [Capillimicrobium parvum]|uniref:MaoC-like domain-containing protein n=2 Tax=Capillimicrobium parvum TaxID=2884022 RepID=A0A9E7C0W7_9ACTN|nr:hypothetical protein DSM104329_02364 [Capillimicrobium parvum]